MTDAILGAAFLLLLGSQPAMPGEATQPSAAAVLAVEQRFTAGLLERNENEVGDLLADDLIHIGFEGQLAGKAEYMSFFKTGTWRYLEYQPSSVSVKLLGEAAVVTGRVDRVIRIADRETRGAFAFTHVWSREGNTWRLESSHVTTIPAPSAGTP